MDIFRKMLSATYHHSYLSYSCSVMVVTTTLDKKMRLHEMPHTILLARAVCKINLG
jgi:hypothetical protein